MKKWDFLPPEVQEELEESALGFLDKWIYITITDDDFMKGKSIPVLMFPGKRLFAGISCWIGLCLYRFIEDAALLGVPEEETRKFFLEIARKYVAEKIVEAFDDNGKILTLKEIFNPK